MKTLKYKYKFGSDYNPTYINGAHGGINPRGEIMLHFYLERQALPNSVSYNLNEEHGILIEPPVKAEPSDLTDSLIRYIETGVVLNLQTAMDIHKFLGDQIENLKRLTNDNK